MHASPCRVGGFQTSMIIHFYHKTDATRSNDPEAIASTCSLQPNEAQSPQAVPLTRAWMEGWGIPAQKERVP
eukprot:c12429_g1_i1 orf=1-213(-)